MNDDRPLQPTANNTFHGDAPLEKDFSRNNIGAYGDKNGEYGNHQHLDSDHDSGAALNRIRTAGSISSSPELFEKIYLSPKNQIAGQLRTTFGNPTPL